MAPELILTYMSGPHDGETIRLRPPEDPAEIVLGRADTCTIRFDYDGDVSRVHARLEWREESWWLVDQHSTNGCYLGEFRQAKKVASPVALAPGQVFRIGSTRLRLENAPVESIAEASGSRAAET